MSEDDLTYHRSRAEHCRQLAQLARDPEVRKRHQQLAELHSGRLTQQPLHQVA
jgi:hypothetical protein